MDVYLSFQIELRKARKEDQILKRRNINADPDFALQDSNGQSPCTKTPEDILIGLDSEHVDLIFDAVQSTRKMLSRERQPPIDLMIQHGIVPKLVKFLDYADKWVACQSKCQVVIIQLIHPFQ